ncbi:MAG: DUF309 domain-containing protein [Halobacteriales archaeon]
MDAHLRAGIAIYNAGGRHAAHDAWEDRWLDLEDGPDERFLHGLIQFTAAVYHGYEGNWAGLRGLAESGRGYLGDLPAEYRGVNVGEVRGYLGALAADPEHVERVAPPALCYEGRTLGLGDLDFAATAVAAEVLAEEVEGYDPGVIEDAVRYAESAVEAGESNAFVGLVTDFVAEAGDRDLIYTRLRQHVQRRRGEERDVEGLFD